jgi:hypothetical protein
LWAKDSITILFLQDFEGNENFHVFAVDVTEEVAANDLDDKSAPWASNLNQNENLEQYKTD